MVNRYIGLENPSVGFVNFIVDLENQIVGLVNAVVGLINPFVGWVNRSVGRETGGKQDLEKREKCLDGIVVTEYLSFFLFYSLPGGTGSHPKRK